MTVTAPFRVPQPPGSIHHVSESELHLKEGHMAVSKDMDWGPLKGQIEKNVRGRVPPKPPAWRYVGPKKRSNLHKDPALPVRVGNTSQADMISVKEYKKDIRDWRKLSPNDVVVHFASLEEHLHVKGPKAYVSAPVRYPYYNEAHEGLMAAVAVGTLQACQEGSFWAPCFEHPDAQEVNCNHIKMPTSRLYSTTPDISRIQPRTEEQTAVFVSGDLNPIDAAQRLISEATSAHIGLVHFTPIGDPRALEPPLGNHREEGLFIRTTYYKALEEMKKHIHAEPQAAVDAGGLIYTADVAILRGPLEDGAQWLPEMPRVDVLWVSMQRNPKKDAQGQYSRHQEKAMIAETVDRVFAVAAAHGIDILVMPPLGVGIHGCDHPAEDMGQILRQTAEEYRSLVPQLCVSREHTDQIPEHWPVFVSSLLEGRTPIEHKELIPLDIMPYFWQMKEQQDEVKKTMPPKKYLGYRPRPERKSFI